MGLKKGYDTLPKAIQKKIDERKKLLLGGQAQLVRGLMEMNEDLKRFSRPHWIDA
jgi:hypothetical protein